MLKLVVKFLSLHVNFNFIKCTFLKAAFYSANFMLFCDRTYFSISALCQSSILLEKSIFLGVLNIIYYPFSQVSKVFIFVQYKLLLHEI